MTSGRGGRQPDLQPQYKTGQTRNPGGVTKEKGPEEPSLGPRMGRGWSLEAVTVEASGFQRLIYPQVSDECERKAAVIKQHGAIIKVTALVF